MKVAAKINHGIRGSMQATMHMSRGAAGKVLHSRCGAQCRGAQLWKEEYLFLSLSIPPSLLVHPVGSIISHPGETHGAMLARSLHTLLELPAAGQARERQMEESVKQGQVVSRCCHNNCTE